MTKSGQTGDGTLEHFNSYKYAPSRPQTQQSHSIFAISNGVNENHSNYTNTSAIKNNNGLPAADC
jgi:hypothetical protein